MAPRKQIVHNHDFTEALKAFYASIEDMLGEDIRAQIDRGVEPKVAYRQTIDNWQTIVIPQMKDDVEQLIINEELKRRKALT